MKFPYQKLFYHRQPTVQGLEARPYIPVILHGRTPSRPFFGLLDSGADGILLPADLASLTGIEYEVTDTKQEVIGIGGQRVAVFFHNIEIEVVGDGRRLAVPVGFSPSITIPLLGRPLFSHFRQVVFKENKEEVELKR